MIFLELVVSCEPREALQCTPTGAPLHHHRMQSCSHQCSPQRRSWHSLDRAPEHRIKRGTKTNLPSWLSVRPLSSERIQEHDRGSLDLEINSGGTGGAGDSLECRQWPPSGHLGVALRGAKAAPPPTVPPAPHRSNGGSERQALRGAKAAPRPPPRLSPPPLKRRLTAAHQNIHKCAYILCCSARHYAFHYDCSPVS